MKCLILSILLLPLYSTGQKTFTDQSGQVFEIKEFNRQVRYDSIFIIEKENHGWLVPDTGHIRNIYTKFFTDNNVRLVNDSKGRGAHQEFDMDGGSYFTSTKDGEVYVYVNINPGIATQRFFKMYYADEENLNGKKKYYNLILIRPKQ